MSSKNRFLNRNGIDTDCIEQEAGKSNLEKERDLEGRSPLHIAAWQGHSAMVELLIAHGADVNAVDREKRTPLQSAAWQGHESVVWLLLKHGADGDQPCSQGATPLSIGIYLPPLINHS